MDGNAVGLVVTGRGGVAVAGRPAEVRPGVGGIGGAGEDQRWNKSEGQRVAGKEGPGVFESHGVEFDDG